MFSVLPPQEHTFTLSVTGAQSGQKFEGAFTYARPTLGTNIQIGKTKAFIAGGLKLDDDTDALVEMMATLRHAIVKAPDWWKESDYGSKLLDLNVLFEIMKQCNDFEKNREQKLEAKDGQDRPA